MLDTLETLCCLSGISGREDEIRDYILERVMPFADEILTDPMGNLMVFKKGDCTPAKKILLAAHMDEVGLIVTDITEKGFLHFGCVGGIDRRVLPSKRVFVGDARIPGVIGGKAMHMTDAGDRKSIPEIEDMYIDIGAKDRDEAAASVSLGDYICFDDTVIRFGEGYLKAKAIDDRVGCATMLALIESRLPCDCWFAFTVQEEVGARGAMTAARSVGPDVALILEGTTAADIPGVSGAARICRQGEGIVIPFMDRGTIYDRELYETLTRLADENGIRWQTKTRIAGGTDGSSIQRSMGGVQTAAISVAIRNIHSPASIARIDECELQEKLARLFLQEMAK